MSGGQYLTPHQKGIVSRFYAHADARIAATLQELVSDLALANGKSADKLWKKAEEAFAKVGVQKVDLERSVGKRDVKAFAEIVAKLVSSPGAINAKK